MPCTHLTGCYTAKRGMAHVKMGLCHDSMQVYSGMKDFKPLILYRAMFVGIPWVVVLLESQKLILLLFLRD